MGRPMKSRILSIALALSMLAVAFCALPTGASVWYTGSVQTTDSAGNPVDAFIQGDLVYVNVELNYMGDPYVGWVNVQLVRASDGWVANEWSDLTNNPVDGWENGSVSGHHLHTGAWFSGDRQVYDVVVWYYDGWDNIEIARQSIVVMKEGLSITPASWMYYPGQTITIEYITRHTTDVFYVQIVNETGYWWSTANWTGQTALDGYWSKTWQIPANFPDGTFMIQARDAGTNAIWNSLSFSVQKYALLVDSDRNYYLPGETANLNFQVLDVSTLAVYNAATIAWNAAWQNESGNWTYENGTTSGSSGIIPFTVHADIALYSDVEMHFWANDTAANRSYEVDVWLYVGSLLAEVGTDDDVYMPGDTVVVTVHAYLSFDWIDLPGANVSVTVERNGTDITGYGATGLVTDLAGVTSHAFALVPEAADGTYTVTATISKAGFSVTRMTSFDVEYGGWINIMFNRDLYYVGETIGMTFQAVWNNVPLTGLTVGYLVYLDSGFLSYSTTTTDAATITLPAGYRGGVQVEAVAMHQGVMMTDWASVQVVYAELALSSVNSEYFPGDAIEWRYQIAGQVSGATLMYEVFDDNGVKVAHGSLAYAATGSFTYTVPIVNPSPEYTAVLTMVVSGGGVVTATDTIDIEALYDIQIWVEKSKYAGGEYKPGSTIDVGYTIESFVNEPLPVYQIYLWISYADWSKNYLVTDTEGTISIEVPDGVASGEFGIYASLYDPMTGDWLSDDSTEIMVNSQLSAWDRSVGGMSAIDFTILVLLIIMILLLIVVPLMKGRMGGAKPAAKSEVPPPPAEKPLPPP
jgi:hypothetical protein